MWRRYPTILLMLLSLTPAGTDALHGQRIPTIGELNIYVNSIIEGMVNDGLTEIADPPGEGILYLPGAMYERGGGDCEDWAMALMVTLLATGVDIPMYMAIGQYPINARLGNLHAIVVFPLYGVAVDALYWQIHPIQVLSSFEVWFTLSPWEAYTLLDVESSPRDGKWLDILGWERR